MDKSDYTYARTADEFWQSEGKRWARETDRFANPSDQLRKSVAEIVSPSDTEEQKARKIYAAVMKLDNTDFSRTRSEAERKAEHLKAVNDAQDVWKQQSGTADQIALLYVALARAAGLKVWPMQVVDRSRAIIDPHYLSANQWDDYIAVIELAGKEVFLDPGQKMCPFGLLHWKHTMAGGIRLASSGPTFAITPPNTYPQNTVQRFADLSISEDGSVKGTLRFVLTGQDALHWRQLTLKNDADEVKKQFNESMREDVPEGVQADFDHFLALDDYNANLIGIVQVTGNLGTATGKHFFLPGLFFESRASHPFVTQDKRATPIDVHYPKKELDDTRYHLPPGFTVESAPHATNVPWPNTAVLAIESRAEGDTVRIVRSLLYNFTLLDSKEYSQVHDFYQKVATADQQQLVLSRAQTTIGN